MMENKSNLIKNSMAIMLLASSGYANNSTGAENSNLILDAGPSSSYIYFSKQGKEKLDPLNRSINKYLIFSQEEWIVKFLDNSDNLNNIKEIKYFYSHIQELMNKKDFIIFSHLLEEINIKKINETLIIGLLRLTYSWNNDIPSWNNFLNKATIELDGRGHISSKLLAGLV